MKKEIENQDLYLVKMLLELQKVQSRWVGVGLLLLCCTMTFCTMYMVNKTTSQNDKIITALFDAGIVVEDEVVDVYQYVDTGNEQSITSGGDVSESNIVNIGGE